MKRGGAWRVSLVGALLALNMVGAWAAATVSVLFRPETAQSAGRDDPAVGAAVAELQMQLKRQGLEVVLPSAEIEALLARSPNAIITFANPEDVVVLVDVIKTQRPYERGEMWADVSVRIGVYRGRQVVHRGMNNGRVVFQPGAEQLGFDTAAQRAVRNLGQSLGMAIRQAVATPPLSTNVAMAAPGAVSTTPGSVSSEGAQLVPKGKRWALLVGLSDFSGFNRVNTKFQAPDLPNVLNDLALLRKTLLTLGFESDHIVSLENAQATTAAVRNALAALRQQVGPDDLVVVYTATHGAPVQGGYTQFGAPLLYDTHIGDADPFDFQRFKDELKGLPAANVIWAIDTCHSGGALKGEPVVVASSRNFKVVNRFGVDPSMAAAELPKNLAVFASSRSEQVSFEHPRSPNGLFSFFFNQGLSQTQGRITMGDLFRQHLEATVPELARTLPCDGGDCPLVQQPGVAFAGNGSRLSLR